MKTQLRLITLIAALILSIGNSLAGIWVPEDVSITEINELGAVSRGETDLPLSARLTSDSFVLDVYAPLGNATVSITDSSGQVVHTEAVSFMSPRQYSVYLADYPEGSYRLLIVFSYGIRLAADFTLQE